MSVRYIHSANLGMSRKLMGGSPIMSLFFMRDKKPNMTELIFEVERSSKCGSRTEGTMGQEDQF